MEQTAKPAEAPKPRSKAIWIVAAVIIVIVVIAGVYFAFYTGAAPDITISDDGACASGATACKFDQSPTVSSGKTVLWKNNGGVPHTVESCDTSSSYASNTAACPNGANTGAAASVRFVSSSIAAGGTFSYKFNTAGTYHYFCNIHLWMHGTVTVS